MSGEIKPGSKPYRARLRSRLTELGFSEEAVPAKVAEQLTTECELRPRTAWRLASELSLDAAARRYNALTGDPGAGMRGTRIWEYEQWPDRGVRPTLPTLRTLAWVYGTTWTALLDLRDLERLPARDLAEYHTALAEVADTRSPGAAFVAADEVIGADSLAEALSLTKTNIDEIQLDELWADVNYLGNAYFRTSPQTILRQLALVREQTTNLLRERQRPKQTTDLFLITAKCAAMMAWIAGDLGRHDSAGNLASAAWLYSQYAGDQLARRWVRTAQARVAFWAGDPVESARLAADGQRYRVGAQLSDAPLILAEARGWATAQAAPQVVDAIARWVRIEDTDAGLPVEDRFFTISKDRRHYMAGTALLSVGQAAPALREFRAARLAYDEQPREHRWEAMDPMIRLDTGRTQLRFGDLDAAAAEVEPLLATTAGKQPDMVRATLKTLAAELGGPRWCGASTARELVDALTSAQANVRQ